MLSLEQIYSFYLRDLPVAIIDLETSGIHAHRDVICEIGAVKMRGDNIFDEYSTLVNPLRKLSPEVIAIHHLTDDMLKDAPLLEDVLPSLIEFMGTDAISGHNIGFDLSFLSSPTRRLGVNLNKHLIIDTAQLSRSVFDKAQGYSLSHLAKRLELPTTNFHRALNDARTTAYLLQHIFKKLEKEGIQSVAELVYNHPFRGHPVLNKELSPLEKKLGLALEHNISLEIRYRNRDGSVRYRKITPERINYPYLYAYCFLREEQRCFRIDRIEFHRLVES